MEWGGPKGIRHVTGYIKCNPSSKTGFIVMTISSNGSRTASGRLQARTTVKPINFLCFAPQAREVFLMGDFNDWNPASMPMKRHFDGSWQLSVPLTHGSRLYQFVVDGQPTNDPRAQGLTRNDRGDKVSMIMVS